ncbi:MAG: serine/threonine-protein kinase [Roseiflexaceae bacterium]|nr:serine/threonine-protein kinase [Roseiflexaceae bacterium]
MEQQSQSYTLRTRRFDPLPVGTVLARRYIIVALLARTQMTSVYLARTHRLGCLVVIKRLSLANEPAGLDRARAIGYLLRESQLLAGIRHRAVPRWRDCFQICEDYYLVMDHMAGKPLSVLIEHWPVSREKALTIMLRLCRVVAYLHERDVPIIHADLKPSNLIFTESGDIILLDFGLARPLFPRRRTQYPIGTIPYAPPEQHAGASLDQRSDIYALGMIFDDLISVSHADQTISRIIQHATEISPSQRYQTVRAMMADLQHAQMRTSSARILYYQAFLWLWAVLCFVVLLGILTLRVPTSPPVPQATSTPALQLLPSQAPRSESRSRVKE